MHSLPRQPPQMWIKKAVVRCCSCSGFVWIVRDRFVKSLEPKQDVQLKPGDGVHLVVRLLDSQPGQELLDVAAGFILGAVVSISFDVSFDPY